MTELHPPSLLIDQGLFNLLVGKERPEAFYNFFSSPIFENLCGSEWSNSPFTVSLATILEAIGKKPPHNSSLAIPSYVQKTGDPIMILEWVRRELQQFYLSKSELSLVELKQAMERQREYCSSEGLKLFDTCVTQIVELPTFHQNLLSFLEFDAIQKFDFPNELKEHMHASMTVFYIFRGNLKVRNASKFRLVKQLWHRAYNPSRLCLDPSAQSELDAANKLMMVKNQSDYLDCDLIHRAVFGIEEPAGFSRVHSFTLDNLETIRLRVRAYKSFLNICQRELPSNLIGATPRNLISRANGKIIACGQDGLPAGILDTACDAPLFDGFDW